MRLQLGKLDIDYPTDGGKGPGGPTPYEGGKNKWSFSEKMLKYLLTFVDIYNILLV